MATDALAVSGIDTFYGDSHVLHGVSFTLQPGRLLGLLGRNGAGKTTCMSDDHGLPQAAARLDQPVRRAVAGLAPEPSRARASAWCRRAAACSAR